MYSPLKYIRSFLRVAQFSHAERFFAEKRSATGPLSFSPGRFSTHPLPNAVLIVDICVLESFFFPPSCVGDVFEICRASLC